MPSLIAETVAACGNSGSDVFAGTIDALVHLFVMFVWQIERAVYRLAIQHLVSCSCKKKSVKSVHYAKAKVEQSEGREYDLPLCSTCSFSTIFLLWFLIVSSICLYNLEPKTFTANTPLSAATRHRGTLFSVADTISLRSRC